VEKINFYSTVPHSRLRNWLQGDIDDESEMSIRFNEMTKREENLLNLSSRLKGKTGKITCFCR
jgi:hypothetical protein